VYNVSTHEQSPTGYSPRTQCHETANDENLGDTGLDVIPSDTDEFFNIKVVLDKALT